MTALFFLVRHGRHRGFGERLLGRTPGVHIDEEGRRQAGRVAPKVAAFAPAAAWGPAAIVASPRERTQDTAAVIGADLGVPVEVDEAFDEIDVGEWAGKRFDELAGDPRWRIWNEDRDHARAPGGETMGEVQARALGGLARLADRYDERIVVVVSHADVIKSVLLSELGMRLGDYWRIDIGPGEFGVLSREPGNFGPVEARP